MEVAHADFVEQGQRAADGAVSRKELASLADRQLQDLGDVLALVAHLEGGLVEALAAAVVAGDVDICQEVHLDLADAVALTGLAAATGHVEREAAWQVAARLGVRQLRKQPPDLVKDLDVRGRVAARRATNR